MTDRKTAAEDESQPPEPATSLDRRDFLKIAGAEALLITAASSANAQDPTRKPAPGRRTRSLRSGQATDAGRRTVKPAPDIVVIGAGAFGGWTAYHLRRMGAKVTLVDAFGPGNSRSTSGDETRGVRSSYGDRPHGELWMRWARDAMGRWKSWDDEWGRDLKMRLYFTTGDLIMRSEWEPYVKDTKANWEKGGVRHEVLTADEVRYRYPVIGVNGITVVLSEPDAGVVRSRRACEAVAEVFRKLGGEIVTARAHASLRRERKLLDLVLLPGNEPLRAETFVFACGPWLPKIFPEILRERIRTSMGNVYYFATPIGDSRFTHPNLPSFNYPGITGWPALGVDNRGFRVRVGGSSQQDPDTSERWIDPSNFPRARRFLAERFRELADAPISETRSCHYESSASRNFIIDQHPDLSNVWIAGGGSAEGFKFGPVVGEYVAKRVLGDEGDAAVAKGFRIVQEEPKKVAGTAPGDGEDEE